MFAQQIEEVRVVGSFKKATIMKGHTVADIVVIFKTLPTKESVISLSQRIIADFRENYPTGMQIADGWFRISLFIFYDVYCSYLVHLFFYYYF